MAMFGRESRAEQERIEAWGQWMRQRNPFALASAALGVFSLIEAGVIPIFSIGGLVLGVHALRQLRRPDASPPFGRRFAWMGVTLCCIALVIGTSLYVHSYLSP